MKKVEKSASKNKHPIKLRFLIWRLQSANPEKKVIPENQGFGSCPLKNCIFFVHLRRYLICLLPSTIAFKHPVKIYIEKQIFLYRFMQKDETCGKYSF